MRVRSMRKRRNLALYSTEFAWCTQTCITLQLCKFGMGTRVCFGAWTMCYAVDVERRLDHPEGGLYTIGKYTEQLQ